MDNYNWQDIIDDEPQSTWRMVGQVLMILAFIVIILFGFSIASAYEDHVRCLNGYEEACIPEDFEQAVFRHS